MAMSADQKQFAEMHRLIRRGWSRTCQHWLTGCKAARKPHDARLRIRYFMTLTWLVRIAFTPPKVGFLV